MKRRLDALEARLSPPVDERPEPPEEVDEATAARTLQILYEAGAFPPHINAAIENEDDGAGELLAAWMSENMGGDAR